MKKKLFLFISIVAMSLMIGCSNTPIVYGDYTKANVQLHTNMWKVTRFDGQYVNWNRASIIYIEPGKHTFELKGEYQPASLLDIGLSFFAGEPDYKEVVIQGEYNFLENNFYTIEEVRNSGWVNDDLSYKIQSHTLY